MTEPPIPRKIPLPPSLRFDTMGIFIVLSVAGLASILSGADGAVRRVAATEFDWAADVWQWGIAIFGLVGALSIMVPMRYRVLALGVEMASRIALGFSALTYGAAIAITRGYPALFSTLTYIGIALMMFIGAAQIGVWLYRQRVEVSHILADDP